MDRPLDSDQLGKKGESRFPELCVDAGLVPNSATWDRKGWDFIVDWRHPAGTTAALDTRPTPLSCLVQLKTVWVETRSVRLRLSSIEHLAKDLKPAFVYVLKVGSDLTYQGAAIAHLEGDFLAFILKALRQASADGQAPNAIEIDVSLAKWFTPIQPTGVALRVAIEAAVGHSMSAYSQCKQAELSELGYEEMSLRIKTTINAPDDDYVIDGFLGLRPIEVLEASAVETRFGIDLPFEALNTPGARIEFAPTPIDKCQVLARPTSGGNPFVFKGKLYRAPAQVMPPGRGKLLVRSALFALVYNATGLGGASTAKVSVNLRTDPNFNGAKVSAGEWADVYGFLAAIDRGEVLQLEVHAKVFPSPLSGAINMNLDTESDRDWVYGAEITAAARAVFARAGWPATKVTIRDIGLAGDRLKILGLLLDDPSRLSPLSFSTSYVESIVADQVVEFYHVDNFRIGPHLIAYLVRAEMAPEILADRIDWRSCRDTVIEVSRLAPSRKAYRAYASNALKRYGAKSHHVTDLALPGAPPIVRPNSDVLKVEQAARGEGGGRS
jgi:hypothetical protein